MKTLQRVSIHLFRVAVIFSLLFSSPASTLAASAAPAPAGSAQAPQVRSISPQDGFLNRRSLSVTVTFDVAMDQAKTQAAFSIQPAVPHKLSWKDTKTLLIEFSEPLEAGLSYALTLAGASSDHPARSAQGAALAEDYRWDYWLDPFKIDIARPASTAISLQFNAVMDKGRTGMPFKIEPSLEGSWKWTGDQAVLFTTAHGFAHAQQYTLSITGPLYDTYGEIKYEGPALTFASPAPIKSVTPAEGDSIRADFGPIQIVFSEPVDPASAQQAFSITPSMPGHFSWSGSQGSTFDDTLSFLPDTLFEVGGEYNLSISPKLQSPAGAALMLSPYSWSFRVEQYYTSYYAPASFGEIGANVQVVDVNGPRKVQFAAGKDLIQFELYRYDLMDFVNLYAQDSGEGYRLNPIHLPAEEENRLVTSWYSQGGDRNGSIDETVIPPEVAPGLYVMNVKQGTRSYSQLFVILTRNTIVAKQSGDEIFAWVSDINGKSVPEAEVRLYSERGEKIREGKTDAQGLYRVSLPEGYTPLLVSAKVEVDKQADVTIAGLTSSWMNMDSWRWWADDPEPYLVYTYTDRPIYRPGQTVSFKSILRQDHDVKYALLPAGTDVTVNVRDPKENLLQSTEMKLSDFGTLNGSFNIAEGATLGSYQIETVVNGNRSRQAFKVEDYRKPDFSVSITPAEPDQANRVTSGASLDLNVDVRYFFGEPVSGAALTYTYYELFPSYQWWNPDPEEISYGWMQTSTLAGQSTQKTSADGSAKIRLDTKLDPQAFDYSSYDDWRSSLRTKTFAVEVTADDGSSQPVSGTYIYQVTNSDAKFSLDSHGYFKQPNSPFTVEARVNDLFDHPLAGRAMSLEVKKWNDKTYDYDLFAKAYALTSDADGAASQEFSLPEGYYTLFLHGKDSQGNTVTYRHWIGVFSTGADWVERLSNEVEIDAEQETYKPYETARYLIRSNFSGPALLTFERGSVIHSKPVMLTAPITVVENQIIPEDAPNVFVTVNAWEPTVRHDIDGNEVYYSNIPDSHLRMARTELLVESDAKALAVSITTDKQVYQPGQAITVNIDVRDSRNQPAAAEVSLALVDESIFSLSKELTPNIFKAFYGPRSLSVDTYDSMSPYRELMEGGRGGGGDEMTSAPRRDFPDTAAWYPALVTDSKGRATITFNLPDNLTSWRLSAKAITVNHQVGEARLNVETKKDLMLRPFLPRVLTTGDQAQLSVMVHNYSAQAREVKVTFQAAHVQVQDAVTQAVTIPAGEAKLVGWRIVPTGTTATALSFRAVADDGSQDAIELPLPVQPLAVTDVQSASGTFEGALSLDLLRPTDALPENSRVTLTISRSPASTLLDGLEFLTGYPYGCVEQTMSRALPNAVLGRAAAQLGVGGEGLQKQLDPLIAASIQKLYGYQHEDGGWGWWFDDRSDDYQTAWVLHGLAVIQSAGYAIEPQVIENGVAYLNQNLEKMDLRTQAYALYSMALAGQGNPEATRALADTSLHQLDPFSQAGLAIALKLQGEDSRAAQVLDLLEASAMQRGGIAYWPQAAADGEYHSKTMASTVRTTAFVLSAILKIEGKDHPLAKPAAEYLIGKRNGYGWGTTNETSFTTLALTDYLLAQEADTGSSEFRILLNGSPLSTGILEPGKMFQKIELPLSSINPGNNKIELTSSGDGPLYYDLVTRYTLSRKAVAPAGEIQLARKYLDPTSKQPLEKIQAGQLVLIELMVTMPKSGSFMLVEDHLPGGLEALNEGLNTTSHVSQDYDPYYERFYWKEYGYNNKEIHGDRVSFFITTVSSGTITLSYLARATHAGTFIALPVEASAMYDPLLWGRSGEATFVVEDQK